MKKSLRFITRSALIGALYFVLSTVVSPLAFGPVQFRLSEALVLLAVFFPEAIPGLTVGCVLANFAFSPYGVYDMLFGGIATFLGAVGTYVLRKNIPLSALPPIVLNALLVPVVWVIDGSDTIYILSALEILASEAVTVGVIGIPLCYALRRAFTRTGILGAKEEIVYKRIPREESEEKDE